jgi:peptidyl-prolyl cis-trans isomerase A (cyclophilin A)
MPSAMMIRLIASLALLLTAPAFAQRRPTAAPGLVRVVIETSAGAITVAVDVKRAPITAGNFLRYVDGKKFDGTNFYRAARAKGAPNIGFIQGGIDHNLVRSFPPIAHEPTSKTGIKHVDGTISMARTDPGTAMGDFFITVGPAPGMDAKPGKPGDNLGYAAFGHVVAGMNVVHKILAVPTYVGRGSAAMKGQMIIAPIRIISAHRAG